MDECPQEGSGPRNASRMPYLKSANRCPHLSSPATAHLPNLPACSSTSQPQTKGHGHTSEEGEVGFNKREQFILGLILLSVYPSCPGLSGANNSSLSQDFIEDKYHHSDPKPTAGRWHTCVSVSTQVPGGMKQQSQSLVSSESLKTYQEECAAQHLVA